MCSRPTTVSTAFRDSQEPARLQSLPASAKARKRTATRSKVSPPHHAQPVSFERKESKPRRCKVSSPEVKNHPSATTTSPHLYMLDESSLASTRQMRAFLEKIKPEDRVLVIGDTAQHQGRGRGPTVSADAGSRDADLATGPDCAPAQEPRALLEAVNHLAKGETEEGH